MLGHRQLKEGSIGTLVEARFRLPSWMPGLANWLHLTVFAEEGREMIFSSHPLPFFASGGELDVGF